jgi:quercetin dioxygenase-like cupin family protein
MKRLTLVLAFGIMLGFTLGLLGSPAAQTPAIQRTELLRGDMPGMDGQEAHMWVADIAPGAATGVHRHPTPRFVYVIAGAVTLEVDGQPPRSFRAGEGFQELPDVGHNFRNASVSEPARALGLQIAAKGKPLQY